MANEDLVGKKMYCVMGDGNEIPLERLRFKAVTCSKACADLRSRMLRKKTDDKECRFCRKASTPNARKAFGRFRKWEKEFPAQAYPAEWALLEAAGVQLEEFSQAIVKAVKFDVDFGSHLSDFGSTKPLPEDDAIAKELRHVLEVLAASRKEEPVAEPAAV